MSDTEGQDRQEILRLHREWWNANHGLDIARMQKVFAGEKYLMYNLNGHPYYGMREKTKLWEHYKKEIDIPELPSDSDVRVEVVGNMGWLACEGVLPIRALGQAGTGAANLPTEGSALAPFRFRATEVYQRDDGEGNPVWKMWHFHCSPLAPEDEPRPGFDDTFTSRNK